MLDTTRIQDLLRQVPQHVSSWPELLQTRLATMDPQTMLFTLIVGMVVWNLMSKIVCMVFSFAVYNYFVFYIFYVLFASKTYIIFFLVVYRIMAHYDT